MIERLLKERCPNSRPPGHEIKKLFEDDSLDVYEPYGEGGPRVDLLSSISLLNRFNVYYCTVIIIIIVNVLFSITEVTA